ncbi:MAG: sterol desaturase family protein [Myxococcales bacterium]|nr:sterol desaturase family protein [Myxococcales bacterium]
MIWFLVTFVGFAVLAPLAVWLERRAGAPARPKSALRVDLAFWLITPLFTGTLARLFTFGVVGLIGVAFGFGTDGPGFLARIERAMPFGRMPWALSFVLAVVFADFVGYLSHRLRHRGPFWRAHAVHHAPRDLVALSAARLHPLDEMLDAVLVGVAVLFVGFPIGVFAALGPAFFLHTLLLHARLPWTFGPLRFVFVSPLNHRRHHAREQRLANFAGVLSLFDVLFGTFDDAPALATGLSGPGADREVDRVGHWLVRPFKTSS